MKKFTYILVFLMCIFLTKEVCGAEIDIYFNNKVTEYKAIEIDGYIYVPLVFYRNYADVELTWLPESQEVEVAFHPWSATDWKVIQTLTIDSAKIIEMVESAETGERHLFAVYHGDYFERPVIIVNERTMIPFCPAENEFKFEGHGYAKGHFLESQIDLRQYQDGHIHFAAYPTIEQLYEFDEIDPDKWVASFDENFGLCKTNILYGSENTAIVCIWFYDKDNEQAELCRITIPTEKYFNIYNPPYNDLIEHEDFQMIYKTSIRMYFNKDFILKKLAEYNN